MLFVVNIRKSRSKLSDSRIFRASVYLHQKRDFWPIIAGGLAIFAAGTVAQYVYRALQAFHEENQVVSEDGKSSSADISPNTQASKTRNLRSFQFSEAVFGIDIGSTFSRVSQKLANSARAEILENREGSRATASTVLHTGDNLVTGQIARNQRLMKSRQTALSPVLFLGLLPSDPILRQMSLVSQSDHFETSQGIQILLQGIHYSPTELYIHILREVKTIVATRQLQSQVIPAVLATPAFFSAKQRQEASAACERSEIDCVSVESDAVCAVWGALQTEVLPTPTSRSLVAVVDVGGRLTQVSVVSISEAGADVTLESTQPLFHIGGDFIDFLLVRHYSMLFARRNGIDLVTDPMAHQRLHDAFETAKIDLSTSFATKVYVPFVSADSTGPLHFEESLSRSQWEARVEPLLQGLREAFTHIMSTSNGNSSDTQVRSNSDHGSISAVLLVGGGARSPLIKKVLEAELQKLSRDIPVVVGSEPEDMVSIGAAELASRICHRK